MDGEVSVGLSGISGLAPEWPRDAIIPGNSGGLEKCDAPRPVTDNVNCMRKNTRLIGCFDNAAAEYSRHYMTKEQKGRSGTCNEAGLDVPTGRLEVLRRVSVANEGHIEPGEQRTDERKERSKPHHDTVAHSLRVQTLFTKLGKWKI